MSISSGEKRPSERPVEIGPPPYYHRPDCNICRKQDGLKTGSELLDSGRLGGYIVEGEHFLAEHAPPQESSAGTVIVEARRHLLDFGEMTPAESAELGSILNRLVPAVKSATGVQRVYFLALMERAPHFHLWLVPKKNEGDLRGVAYLDPPGEAAGTCSACRCRRRSGGPGPGCRPRTARSVPACRVSRQHQHAEPLLPASPAGDLLNGFSVHKPVDDLCRKAPGPECPRRNAGDSGGRPRP